MSKLSQDPGSELDQAWRREGDPDESLAYTGMIAALRDFLDKVAAAQPDDTTIASITETLQSWSGALTSCAVEPGKQLFGRQFQAPGRGSAMLPFFLPDGGAAPGSIRGSVTFGRYYSGASSNAVHGGAIALLFDDMLGRLANLSAPAKARTAFLRIDYRAVTPVNAPLEARAWFLNEDGRKRRLRGELRHGETLCAEAEGLFIVLNPGQP